MTEIRALTQHTQFADAVQLQRLIWGWEDLDLIPMRFFVVAVNIGGQVFGAFDESFMFGFCLAIPGVKLGGMPYLHSHMLGVLPEYRNSGAGAMLKLAQRDDALARGFSLIEWTFDPFDVKNAYFNIEKLGAVVRRFVPNQYGTTTSRLHGGFPTDRCTAEWHPGNERPQSIIEARIQVPSNMSRLRREEPEHARDIQRRTGERFLELFSKGLAVIGFERSDEYGVYLLGILDPPPWVSK